MKFHLSNADKKYHFNSMHSDFFASMTEYGIIELRLARKIKKTGKVAFSSFFLLKINARK